MTDMVERVNPKLAALIEKTKADIAASFRQRKIRARLAERGA